ncbi:AzlC family ABC transporter permease [Kocuria turfanensis]|uniref:AzlC family ABC transporter permease n=1 Tax=Kocuria turfanensis TaxID=388357 RepID=UPI004035284A
MTGVRALRTPRRRGTPRLPWISREALGDVAPLVLVVLSFGFVVGSAMRSAGIPVGPGLVVSALIYGGSAHIGALGMVAAGAGAPAVLVAVVIINARWLLYGAALAPHFQHQPAWFRWLGPMSSSTRPTPWWWPARVAAFVSMAVAVAAHGLPFGLAALAGTAAGIIAARLVGRTGS